jgi:hypothetical protein
MDHPLICRCQTFPIVCSQSDDNFIIKYNINELNEANKYVAEGSVTYRGSATWENFKNASFTLLLVEKGVIVDTVSIAGGQGSLDRTIKFTREFTSVTKFEAVLIDYRMNVKG